MGANRSDWFGDSPGALRQFARLGLRMVTIGQATRELGWDVSDELRSGGRMTALGVRMIEEMNRCGILVDLAHTNDPCALDAIEVSEKPVIDTHSGPRALEEDPSPRSTPDEVMKALAANGGMLGITPPIGRPEGDAPYESVDDGEMEATLKQIRYAVEVMGARRRRHRHALQLRGHTLDNRGAARGRLFRGGHGEDHGGQLPPLAARGAAGVTGIAGGAAPRAGCATSNPARDSRAFDAASRSFRCVTGPGRDRGTHGWIR